MRERPLSWLEELGLGDDDTSHFFDLASARLDAGNPQGAIEAADQAVAQFDGLRNAGIRTVALLAGAGLVALMILVVLVKQAFRLLRRNSSPTSRLETFGSSEITDVDDRVA